MIHTMWVKGTLLEAEEIEVLVVLTYCAEPTAGRRTRVLEGLAASPAARAVTEEQLRDAATPEIQADLTALLMGV